MLQLLRRCLGSVGSNLYVYANQELLSVIDITPLLDSWKNGPKNICALQRMMKDMQDEIYRTIDNGNV